MVSFTILDCLLLVIIFFLLVLSLLDEKHSPTKLISLVWKSSFFFEIKNGMYKKYQ